MLRGRQVEFRMKSKAVFEVVVKQLTLGGKLRTSRQQRKRVEAISLTTVKRKCFLLLNSIYNSAVLGRIMILDSILSSCYTRKCYLFQTKPKHINFDGHISHDNNLNCLIKQF